MLKGVPTTHRSRKLRSATKEGNTSRGAPNWAAWARETGGHSWGTAEVAVRRISSLSPCPSISCNQRQVWGFVIHRTLGTIQKRRLFFFFLMAMVSLRYTDLWSLEEVCNDSQRAYLPPRLLWVLDAVAHLCWNLPCYTPDCILRIWDASKSVVLH